LDGERNVPIEIWNVNVHRYGTDDGTESWNSKLSSIIGKQQPYVFLLVQKLKEEAVLVSWRPYLKVPGESGQKRGKAYVKQDDRF
jgi:hypothetical protein